MRELALDTPIPEFAFPDTGKVVIEPCDDPLICISDEFADKMVFQPMYYEQGISGAIPSIWVRKTVADKLERALSMLPDGYRFKIYDAWRPFLVQKSLFDEYHSRLKRELDGSGLSDDEIFKRTLEFVSYPSEDPYTPFVHSTGGAVDLTIVDSEGNELNMGTDFDDFTSAAHTRSFESSDCMEVRDNRRMLYNTMISVGFTNLPSEWWHYDYGDRFWGALKHRKSKYTGIYSL